MARGEGEACGVAVEVAGMCGEGICFATWTSCGVGSGRGWFSWKAIQTSKPAAIAPAGASHCQRAPLKRRTRRDFLGAAAAGGVARLRAVKTGLDSFAARISFCAEACKAIWSV